MDASRDMELSDSGWRELKGLGERLGSRIPGLNNTTSYDVRYTNYQTGGYRSRDSTRAFLTGLFGSYGQFLFHFNFTIIGVSTS